MIFFAYRLFVCAFLGKLSSPKMAKTHFTWDILKIDQNHLKVTPTYLVVAPYWPFEVFWGFRWKQADIAVQGGGYRRVKSTLFAKIRNLLPHPPPPKKKKVPTPEKARKIWPDIHLYPGQNLHEKHILKRFFACGAKHIFQPNFSNRQFHINMPFHHHFNSNGGTFA